jgi:hypothetical protein
MSALPRRDVYEAFNTSVNPPVDLPNGTRLAAERAGSARVPRPGCLDTPTSSRPARELIDADRAARAGPHHGHRATDGDVPVTRHALTC